MRKHCHQHVCQGNQIMKSNIQHNRDPLMFSLRGARWSIRMPCCQSSRTMASTGHGRPVEAARASARCCEESAPTRQIEALLARYFAHGCCNAA